MPDSRCSRGFDSCCVRDGNLVFRGLQEVGWTWGESRDLLGAFNVYCMCTEEAAAPVARAKTVAICERDFVTSNL